MNRSRSSRFRPFRKRARRRARLVYANGVSAVVLNDAGGGAGISERWKNSDASQQFEVLPPSIGFYLGRNKLRLATVQMFWRLKWTFSVVDGSATPTIAMPRFCGFYFRKVALAADSGLTPQDAGINPWAEPATPASITDWQDSQGTGPGSMLFSRFEWGPNNLMYAALTLTPEQTGGTTTAFVGGAPAYGSPDGEKIWIPPASVGIGPVNVGGTGSLPVRDAGFMDIWKCRSSIRGGEESIRCVCGFQQPDIPADFPADIIQMEFQMFWRCFAW